MEELYRILNENYSKKELIYFIIENDIHFEFLVWKTLKGGNKNE